MPYYLKIKKATNGETVSFNRICCIIPSINNEHLDSEDTNCNSENGM